MEEQTLHFISQQGDIVEVKRLLSEGVNPNLFDDLGMSPLMYAAKEGHTEIMKILIKAGADVNIHDEKKSGNTALREVAENCTFEVAKILIDAGADPTIPGWMQLTAIHKSEKRKRGDGPKVHSLLVSAAKKRRP